jgi:hypothetical protein
VRVVTAGVHLSVHLGGKGQTAAFADRQSVHVGSQRDGSSWIRAVNACDDAGLGHTAVLDAERIEFSLDQRRGFVFLKSKLRPPVDAAPQLHNAGRERLVYIDSHRKRSYRTGTLLPAAERRSHQ